LIANPQDRVWITSGLGSIETYWNGYDWQGYIEQYTEHWLNTMLPFLVSYYQLDVNRIYGTGKSMGGLGMTHWGIRQNSQPFAAVFARVPVWWISNVTSMTQDRTIKAPNELVAGTTTTYDDDMNSPAWVLNCNNSVPPVMWGSGRLDTSFPNYSMWTNSVHATNALVTCHRGFAFAWNNGNHSTGGAPADQLYSQYQTVYRRNVSYPAFAGFSLDSDPGDGTTNAHGPINGDLVGCINCGWTWQVNVDTASQWSVDISNSQITSSGTVDVTPRNAQSFMLVPGTTVNWTATGGLSGTVIADQYGLATIHLSLGTGTTTVTMNQ
jgi:hypothetical protein